jgi:hypothetical protein
MGTSILALPLNLENDLKKCSSAASSPTTSSTLASSLSASLTSPMSGALLYVASIASIRVKNSLISLSIGWLAKGRSRLLGGVVLIVCHT